jgi:hypothetical protein
MQAVLQARHPSGTALTFRLVAQRLESKLQQWRDQASNSTMVSAHPNLSKCVRLLPWLGVRHWYEPSCYEDVMRQVQQEERGVQADPFRPRRCAVCYRHHDYRGQKVVLYGELTGC